MKINYGVAIENWKEEAIAGTSSKGILVSGTAIKEVVSRNGVKYMAKELEKSAHTLAGRPMLKDHKNDVDHIIGKVTSSVYKGEDKSIRFTGIVTDEKVKELIQQGLINHVSIGAACKLTPQESDGENCVVAENIEFLELSVTPVPGVPDASISAGEGFAMAVHEAYTNSNQAVGQVQEAKCPECGKVVPPDAMKQHMADHTKKKEQMQMEEKKMADELNLAKESLCEAIMAFDSSWKKEDLMVFTVEALRKVLERAKTVVVQKKEEKVEVKAEAKGVVETAPVQKQEDVLVIQASENSNENLRGVKAGQFVVERTGKKMAFWKMPDYKKQLMS